MPNNQTLANTKGRTDENGYLKVTVVPKTGPDGPLRPAMELQIRVDANGYLIVAQ